MATPFGEYIRKLRKDRRLSQMAAADAIGIRQSYLSDLERGTVTNPSRAVVKAMAGVYGVPYGDLTAIAWEVEEPPEEPPVPVYYRSRDAMPAELAMLFGRVGPALNAADWARIRGYVERVAEEHNEEK